MKIKIRIGDIVKIIDDGVTYTTYEEAAVAMGLKNWIYGHSRSTKNRYYNEYTVVGMFEHPIYKGDRSILGITNGVEEFVIGAQGVELISEQKKIPLIPEEAKGPQLFDINNLYPYTDIAG
jgi:hypothetical protein